MQEVAQVGDMVRGHIREGRFQRSLAVIAGLASMLSGLEVLTEHYRGSYSQRIMYSPIILSPALLVAGLWAALSRRAARTALPLVSVLTILDGVVGFVFHVRGIKRKPGGWRIPVANLIMGPPVLAPLLFAISGYLGLIASLLRREGDMSTTEAQRHIDNTESPSVVSSSFAGGTDNTAARRHGEDDLAREGTQRVPEHERDPKGSTKLGAPLQGDAPAGAPFGPLPGPGREWVRRLRCAAHTQAQRIGTGRFQQQMAAAAAISALFSGVEALYSHYKNNFQYRSQWTPILLTPVLCVAGFGAIGSKTIARTLLPLASILALLDGALGFVFHVRGMLRRPGGLRYPLYNVMYGPPIFAPLLFAASGFLGLLASLLRRAE